MIDIAGHKRGRLARRLGTLKISLLNGVTKAFLIFAIKNAIAV